MTQLTEISFETTKEEFATIGRIADRYKAILNENRKALGPNEFDRADEELVIRWLLEHGWKPPRSGATKLRRTTAKRREA